VNEHPATSSGPSSSPRLEARFLDFLAALPGSERIDGLSVPSRQGVEIADFLLADRQVIVEVKSLETDTASKVREVLQKHENRPEYPVFYGDWPLERILAHLPDGAAIRAEIYERVTRSIERAFKKADHQVAGTKVLFQLQASVGLLVLLSGSIDIFSPEILAQRVSQMLLKRSPGGEIRYSNVQWVCIVSETHYAPLGDTLKAMPMIEIEGPTAESYPGSATILDDLRARWAKHCGHQLFVASPKRVADSAFRSFTADVQDTASNVPRHELWRREYRAEPYLAKLDAEELREYAVTLFHKLKPCFIKSAEKPADDTAQAYMIRFTHLLEEVNRRGVDMRDVLPSDRLQRRYPHAVLFPHAAHSL
jgi:hypothetical protein